MANDGRGPARLVDAAAIAAPALAVSALAVIAMALAVHASAVQASTDDYCNRIAATVDALPEALRKIYLEWTGRLVTTALLYAAFATVDLPRVFVLSVALSFLFAGAAWLVAWVFTCRHDAIRLPLAAFALAALTLGLYGLLRQVVFWPTGGIVYLVPLVLLLAFIGSTRRLVLHREPGLGAAAGFALGAFTGNASELVVPIAVAHAAALLVPAWTGLGRGLRRVAAWRLGGLAAGALVLALAPGNWRRAAATPGSFPVDPEVVVPVLGRMLAAIAAAGLPMFVLCAGLAVVAFLARHTVRGGDLGAGAPRVTAVREALALAAGGLLSVLPVLVAPAQFAPRNGLFLLVALLLAVLALGVPAFARWRSAPLALALGAAAGALVVSGLFTDNVVMARDLRGVLVAQDRALRDAAARGQRDVEVPPWRAPVPETLHAIEPAADPSRWDNRCIARYHGLASVRRAEGRP